MTDFHNFKVPYKTNKQFSKRVAYFSMEFGIDQALKIYSGGLGYLAGSHMRSAFQLKQNLVGIGMLWKYGYYDQVRQGNGFMTDAFIEKHYNFLEDTGIEFEVKVNNHPVIVKAWYLAPEVFGTAPIFLLSTIHPQNDYLAQSISHQLYDQVSEAKIASGIILGIGGAKLLDILNFNPDIYHLNEAHALSAAFHLYGKSKDLNVLKKQLVFTTHTPVPAGNEKHNIYLLDKMGFFEEISLEEVRHITKTHDDTFNHTLAGLRMSGIANGVSKMHGEVARDMWTGNEGICPIIHITNSQNKLYWADKALDKAADKNDKKAYRKRKRELKKELFKIVADQTGTIMDPDVLTMVWARRFAPYKRADLITHDMEQFERLVGNTDKPIQIIWAGKPYPKDQNAIAIFNKLEAISRSYGNCAVLVGYELALSKALKQGSDVWLNTPRVTREASGTSGMTAAMNGSVNLSTFDGWIPEFAKHGENAFIIPSQDPSTPHYTMDEKDRLSTLEIINREILPVYYDSPDKWAEIVFNGIKDVTPFFDSDRMATEYYQKLFSAKGKPHPGSV